MSEQKPAQPEPELSPKQLLKIVLEIGPVAVFFAVNAYYGIFWGTGAFMVATLISLIASQRLLGNIPTMPLVSGACILIFGGLTLLLQDELFIKMKPTIVNCLFAGLLLGGLAFGQKFIKLIFGEVFHLTEEGWRVLTIRWALFFLHLAALNEIVWRTSSTEYWISFKIWGVMPLTMAFAVAQVGLLKRYEMRPDDQPQEGKSNSSGPARP